MDLKKVAIIFLVLFAVVAFMALGAGAYRDRSERGGRSPRQDEEYPVAKFIDRLTSVFRSRFDLDRLRGCSRSGNTVTIADRCELLVAPGSARPARFKVSPANGVVALCFAMTRQDLVKCLAPGTDPDPEELEEPAEFTVAKDTSYLHLDCLSSGSCAVTVR
jgi:hypothetical protein